MGNYAHVDPEVEAYVAEKLGMKIDRISTQVSQRDRLGAMFSVLANYASTLEKMATEIRLYQQSEISELMEGFGTGQKGSSSMPHKKNPISSENITGLSRLIRSAVIPGFENNVL
jgi:adenylosuccinate lyase